MTSVKTEPGLVNIQSSTHFYCCNQPETKKYPEEFKIRSSCVFNRKLNELLDCMRILVKKDFQFLV